MRVSMKQGIAVLALLIAPLSSAWAQWELDSAKSAINFISIKNSSVAETHSFSSVVGYISSDGKVQVGIDLDGVETMIEIRNERMRQLLFETAKFPAANITAQIDAEVLDEVAQGGTVSMELPVTLSLHGMEKTINAALIAVGEVEGPVRVFTARPIILSAADFGLEGGVAALQEIAGLQAISRAVPVSLHLVFTSVE